VVKFGVTPRNHMAQEGVSRGEWYNSPSGETLVGMYKLEEAMKKPCSNLLVVHHRKCKHDMVDIL
jgi:hypothetical protein